MNRGDLFANAYVIAFITGRPCAVAKRARNCLEVSNLRRIPRSRNPRAAVRDGGHGRNGCDDERLAETHRYFFPSGC